MQYLPGKKEVLSDDEVDTLFDQLKYIEPPEWLIQSILDCVSQLPVLSTAEQQCASLMVHSDGADPS